MCISSLAGVCISTLVRAQDSTLVEELSESVVTAVRAPKNAPYAVANVKMEELQEFSTSGLELPLLLSRTPGVLAWGENGLGTGTAYMRIRGAGDSRINVTLDGVPLNSPEDQSVFWANMNSYSALLGSVQIQRGVGSSTNGDGAFGGSVSLSTKKPSYVPGGQVSASYGSYNTFNLGASFSTGLLWNRLAAEGAYHETSTDGYMHGTAGRSGSYYGALTLFGRNFILRYKNIGNFENTGQAWNGVTAGNNDATIMGDDIKTYKDLYDRGLGQFNSLYEYLVFDEDAWAFVKDADGNYRTERYKLKDGSLWRQTTDNFWQDHNILSFSGRISDRLSANASLHYTYGYGYYDEFRPGDKLKKFGLTFPGVSKTDFVRQKGLEQHTYGLVGNMEYKSSEVEGIAGISLQQFRGNHFGYLTYIADAGVDDAFRPGGKNYQYYDSDALKNDFSGFIKAVYHFSVHFDAFADFQFRHVDYRTGGKNDKFYDNGDGTWSNQILSIDKHYNFFNPKAGINFVSGSHRAYASVALSHREPERNNFTDNGSYPAPRPESVLDYEAGYQYNARRLRLGANFYFMDYTDQFVQTGALSDIGEALTTNIRDSYRAGVEIVAGRDIGRYLTLEGNAALSRNRILDFDEHVEDWDNGEQIIHYADSPLAYSPEAILNGFIDLHAGGFKAAFHTGFVSRMYLDNTGNRDRSLPAYTASDINLSYTLKFPKIIRETVFGLRIGNIFNARYAQSGWVYSAIAESYGYSNENRYYQIGFIPAAGITAMGSVVVRF